MSPFTSQVDRSSAGHHRAERRNSPDLAAYHWKDSIPRENSVRDISSTGAYLFTKERWQPGEVISLAFQRSGPLQRENSFSVHAKAVRWDEHGVAVSFVLPPGADLRLWQSPLKSAAEQNAPEDILREFRISQAISFFSRICPDIKDSMSKVLHEELSNYRLENAIEIALKAEKMLGASVEADKLFAKPIVVRRVVESGSWADDKWMLPFWSGLLTASCTTGGNDESTLVFVELLSQIKALHMRILSAASNKSTKLITGTGHMATRPLNWTAADLMRVSGSHDLIKLDRELNYMADIGVFAPRVQSAFFQQMTDTTISPTALGLELYARCNGYRGKTQSFYGIGLTLAGAIALGQ